jgi:hypothetical protein
MWTRRAFVVTAAYSLIVDSLRCYGQLPEAPIPRTKIAPERTADSYAIYSLLLAGLENPRNSFLVAGMTCVPQDVPTLAGTSKTTLEFRQNLQGESKVSSRIVVPKDRAPQYQQVSQALADYQQRKADRVSLETKLELPHRYRLLNAKEVREWLSLQGGSIDPVTHQHELKKWADWGPLVCFSEVYFSESQAMALVWGRVMTTCGVNGWYLLEKSHGRWSRLLWTTPIGACDSDGPRITGAAVFPMTPQSRTKHGNSDRV